MPCHLQHNTVAIQMWIASYSVCPGRRCVCRGKMQGLIPLVHLRPGGKSPEKDKAGKCYPFVFHAR